MLSGDRRLPGTATSAVDLPEAHRSVSCVSGDNGFTLAWWGRCARARSGGEPTDQRPGAATAVLRFVNLMWPGG